MNDCDAWQRYPEYRWVFNKLALSLKMNYDAGPAGTSVFGPGEYVIRPIYNLSGMGVGAELKYLDCDNSQIPAGYFWCERFHGDHITVNWERIEDGFVPVEAAIGIRTPESPLYKFSKWRLLSNLPPDIRLPGFVSNSIMIDKINTEFIGDKLIEIHLRWGVDFPTGATELVPVWYDDGKEKHQHLLKEGWCFQEDFDDADGQLENPRLGFFYR